MARKMVVIPEAKDVVDRMKKRYEYIEKKGKGQVFILDIKNKLLKSALEDANVAPEVEIPSEEYEYGMSEIAGLLKCPTSVEENKCRTVARSKNVQDRINYVNVLSEQMVALSKGRGSSLGK